MLCNYLTPGKKLRKLLYFSTYILSRKTSSFHPVKSNEFLWKNTSSPKSFRILVYFRIFWTYFRTHHLSCNCVWGSMWGWRGRCWRSWGSRRGCPPPPPAPTTTRRGPPQTGPDQHCPQTKVQKNKNSQNL